MSDEKWFIDAYDKYVRGEAANATALEKSLDAVAHSYADAVERGEIQRTQSSAFEEGKQLASRFIRPARDRRRNSMRKSLEHIRDALRGETVLGSDDPVFAQAFPLGDGTDKVLGYWSPDDYRNATTERYRNAAAATKAASEFDEIASEIADTVTVRGVPTTAAAFAARAEV